MSNIKSSHVKGAERLTSLHKLKQMIVGTAVLRIKDWRVKRKENTVSNCVDTYSFSLHEGKNIFFNLALMYLLNCFVIYSDFCKRIFTSTASFYLLNVFMLSSLFK